MKKRYINSSCYQFYTNKVMACNDGFYGYCTEIRVLRAET